LTVSEATPVIVVSRMTCGGWLAFNISEYFVQTVRRYSSE
jgi:hypothetical protein